ncbi:MAG: MFS transporter [Usitatibacteraceae bacterium]
MRRLQANFLAPYLAYFRLPDVALTVLITWFARMPFGMIGLAMLMYLRESLGNFQVAGSVLGAYYVTMATCAPVCGRIIDRIGPHLPLRITGVLHSLFLAALFFVASNHSPTWVVTAAAALAGAFSPPIAVLTRTLWRHRFPDEINRRMAFSVDSIMIELNFTIGPALIALVISAFGTRIAFLLAIAVTFCAFIIFLFTPALRYWKQEAQVERHFLGPLTEPRLVGLFIVTFGLTFSFGILEVGYPAFATSLALPVMAGVFLGINSLGSAIGGAVYGVLHLKAPLERQFALALGFMSLPFLLHWWVDQAVVFAIIAFIAGTLIAPGLTAQTMLITRIAPDKYATEAFTWSSTFIVSGIGVGMAAGGAVAEMVNVKTPFLIGAIVLAGMSLAALLLQPKPAIVSPS